MKDSKSIMELRMYKYRLYPSKKQKEKLINSLKTCKTIYNELLALSIDAYKFGKVSFNKFDFNNYLTGKYLEIHSQSKQNVSDRVHKSFQNFFRRIKSKEKKKGFPHFKNRVNSFTYPQNGFKFVSDNRLYCNKIGNIPITLHRIPRGKIKTLTIKCNKINQWFACFSCEIEEISPQNNGLPNIGIDLGKEHFIVGSDGCSIDYPFFREKANKKLKKLHRKVSKKKKGSKNRLKARIKLSKAYLKISNQREDWLHKLSYYMGNNYSIIAHENLNVKKLIESEKFSGANRKTLDCAWNSFLQKLTYKAITSEVNPKNTTKECSNCGNLQEMPLSKRLFVCDCGVNLHRDLNASLNIHSRAGLVRTYTPLDIKPLPFSL